MTHNCVPHSTSRSVTMVPLRTTDKQDFGGNHIHKDSTPNVTKSRIMAELTEVARRPCRETPLSRHASTEPRSASTIIWLALVIAIATQTACRRDEPKPVLVKGPIQLADVTERSGIQFVHTDGSSGRRFIVEPMSAGLALFDYDNDGWIDIYFLNGAPLPGTQVTAPPQNRLYRNNGDGTFTDVTDEARVGDTGFGLGVAAADYDNDGDADLYLNNCGPNALYCNNGDGTFSNVTLQAGVANGDLVGAGTAFFDMDADGDADLYVANYLEFDESEHVQRTVKGYPSYPSPRDFQAIPDSLFRNNGDGTFTDVSEASGVASCAGTGMGIVTADADDDGDTDVFVLNDVAENFFFRNDGAGNFEEVATLVGLAYNGFGQENASMGVDCGDLNNDGWIDFFMTSYQAEFPVFYRNLGAGRFEDATRETRAGIAVFPFVNWGTGLIDFDNDGDRDIFIANGHTEDNVDLYDTSTGYRVKNTVVLNEGDGHFVNVSDQCGSGLLPTQASRGAGFDDLDNDGWVDGVVLNSRERPLIVRNESQNSNHWIQLCLFGRQNSRDALGTKVRVMTGSLTQIAEVHSGRGYQSHFGLRLHFGLGDQAQVDHLEVHWLGGGVDRFHDLPADQLLRIVEGSGR